MSRGWQGCCIAMSQVDSCSSGRLCKQSNSAFRGGLELHLHVACDCLDIMAKVMFPWQVFTILPANVQEGISPASHHDGGGGGGGGSGGSDACTRRGSLLQIWHDPMNHIL